MFFCIIGPSGVGKSTLLNEYGKKYSADIKIIDEIIKNDKPKIFYGTNWGNFWNETEKNLEQAKDQCSKSETLCLIDIGAGSLKSLNSLKYFENYRENTIVILDSPKNVWKRILSRPSNPHKSFKEYKKEEFSKKRKRIYQVAKYKLYVSGEKKEWEDYGSERLHQLIKTL